MRGTGSMLVMLGASMACGEPEPAPSGDTRGEATMHTESSSGPADSSSGAPSGPARSLVVPEAWTLAEAGQDPFSAERPELVECALGWGEETGAFEVSTDFCLYGAFVQPTRAEIQPGDVLELVILHDALYAIEPATAHLGMAFGDEIVWETELAIPSEPALVRPHWVATSSVAQGSPVHFHVHNHGTNNYRLIDLTVARP